MRLSISTLILALAAGVVGCAGTELAPVAPGGAVVVDDQNPVYIPLGQYGTVFENCLTVLSDYGFQFDYASRYDGRIESKPRVSPGLGLFLKPGSPDCYIRSLSTAQSYRNRARIMIHPAEQGGYFIEVIVTKELEDLPKPIKSVIGAAIFHIDTPLDRDSDVIDSYSGLRGWIYKGRDPAFEQEIIRRLKKLM